MGRVKDLVCRYCLKFNRQGFGLLALDLIMNADFYVNLIATLIH